VNIGSLDDSGIDNHDQQTDNSMTVDGPANIPAIAADVSTIPAIAADVSTIPATAVDAPTTPAIAIDAPTTPAIAQQARPSARLFRPRITRRRNSYDDWVDLQTNEVAGRAGERTLSYVNSDKQKKLRHENLMQLLRREKKKSFKLKQKITELENERDCVPLKIRKQLSRMVVSAFNGGKAEIFLLDQIQNYGKLQGARWTETTVAHCIILNGRAPGAYEFLRKSGILHLPCRQTLQAYTGRSTLETGVGSLVKKRLMSESENLSHIEKNCSLVLDEMTIGPGEEYIPQLDKFVGKVDMGGIVHPNDQNQLANKMLGYIVVGLNTYFKIPVAYFLVSQLTAKEQEALTLQVIKDVEDCGFKINRLVTDNLAVNTNMFKRMNGGVLHPVIRHPIQEYSAAYLILKPWVY
jgi:hypothetical protein